MVERYQYSPYGEATILDANFALDANNVSDIGNEFLYTGRRLDPETGLYQFRHRYYHAQLGRFVNRDPIGYRGGMNLYAYVGGMPTTFVDPLGLVRPNGTRPGNVPPRQFPNDRPLGAELFDAIGNWWNPPPNVWTGNVVTGTFHGGQYVGEVEQKDFFSRLRYFVKERTDENGCKTCVMWSGQYKITVDAQLYIEGEFLAVKPARITYSTNDKFDDFMTNMGQLAYLVDSLDPGLLEVAIDRHDFAQFLYGFRPGVNGDFSVEYTGPATFIPNMHNATAEWKYRNMRATPIAGSYAEVKEVPHSECDELRAEAGRRNLQSEEEEFKAWGSFESGDFTYSYMKEKK